MRLAELRRELALRLQRDRNVRDDLGAEWRPWTTSSLEAEAATGLALALPSGLLLPDNCSHPDEPRSADRGAAADAPTR